MNYLWNYVPSTPEQEAAAKQMSETEGLNPTICRLLLQRGISTADAVPHYFRPQISDLHDPFLMNDMDVAVERLNEAIGRKERIMVYGDYDVDGCTAVALVYRFLAFCRISATDGRVGCHLGSALRLYAFHESLIGHVEGHHLYRWW